MVDAARENDANYWEVVKTGLGALYCVGCERYGRWDESCIKVIPDLAREHARGLHPRVRRGTALGYQRSLVSVALQKSMTAAVLRDHDENLPSVGLEPAPDLPD